jgi:hypothetical protein
MFTLFAGLVAAPFVTRTLPVRASTPPAVAVQPVTELASLPATEGRMCKSDDDCGGAPFHSCIRGNCVHTIW